MSQQFYQVGGSLPADAQSYIKREADDKLYNYLKEGKYCYILNARQVGKSSLRVQTSKRLEEEGYNCINIDLTSIGSEDITADEWYFSFIYQIIEQLSLEENLFIEWWEENDKLTVVNRFAKTLDKFILAKTTQKIVIFIDEVDAILGIKKDFSANDFFAVIRTFYNLRSEDERYNRVSFSIFGVATPEDLMRDSSRTPFNIAHGVTIKQFKLEESLSLLDGLANQKIDSRKILERIFEWTSGTPYLTQKILDYIVNNPIDELEDINNIVDVLFIQESFKEINISNIHNRIISNEQYNVKMLYLISEIINHRGRTIEDGSLEQVYLKLSGLMKEKKDNLLYTNKIYQKVFTQEWLTETLGKIDRPLSQDLQRWIELNKANSALLKGKVLQKANLWASGRDDLSREENEYLRLSMLKNQEDILNEEKKKTQFKRIQYLTVFSFILFLLSLGLGYEYFEIEKQKKIVEKHKLLLTEKIKIVEKQNEKLAEKELKFQKQEELLESTLFSETLKDSKKTYLDALDRYKKLSEENPTKYKPKVAKVLKNLATIYNVKNDLNRTVDSYNKALNIYETLDAKRYIEDRAKIYNNLAGIYTETKYFNKAEKNYNQALSIYRKLNQKASIAKILNNLANLNIKLKRTGQSKKYFIKSLKLYEELYEELAEQNPKYLTYVASISQNLADISRKNKDIKESIFYYTKAFNIFNNLENSSQYSDELSKLSLQIELNNLDKKKELPKKKEIYKKSTYKKNGWVYLGEYNKSRWIKKYFGFNKNIPLPKLVNSFQISKYKLNVREEAYFGKVIGGLKIGDKIKIIKIEEIGVYKWAYIEY